jgi:RNA-directed DNA polymerase
VGLDRPFADACDRHPQCGETLIARRFWITPRMAAPRWPVPNIATTTALAGWIGLTPAHLDWFADCQGREARTPAGPMRHYLYRWVQGRRGKRLLEVPKPRLKAIQRKILHELLDHVPAHEAAHGYRRGRSVVSYAAPHAGRRIVLRIDLREFFPSVRGARVRALFLTLGYPLEVARHLAGLCTNVVPDDVWPVGSPSPGPDKRPWFRSPHLPQGAPTSPAVANLCAHRLDRRLAGLAAKLGASYTRYADDLAFSGGEELERRARAFHVAVCRIALEEGFAVNTRKTRFMRRAARQHLAGVVVNEKVNCRRTDYDRLKATLTNCARHGPADQNREGHADFKAHLAGQIAHLARLSPARAAKLRALFDRVEWPA